MPVPAHERVSEADCHHAAPIGIAFSHSDSSSPGCDHSAGTACAAMLGCVVLPSALSSAATRFWAPFPVAVAAPFVNGAPHGCLGIGPPTPPPNS